MVFRTTTSGPRSSLPIVANRGEEGRSRPRVLATRGRLDPRQQSGPLDPLRVSGARRSRSLRRLSEHAPGQLTTRTTRRSGPARIFPRRGRETGCPRIIERRREGRRFAGDDARAIVLTVRHRRCAPGRDRAADPGKADDQSDRGGPLQLHPRDRAMAWLDAEWPQDQPTGQTPFAPRCLKDRIEEELFAHRRDLVTDRHLVFVDTTSISVAGKGGDDRGPRGFSPDPRPDLDPMIVGAVRDGPGRPLGCALGPGNTTDVTTLIPVGDRLRSR